jgi:hypothetical protein
MATASIEENENTAIAQCKGDDLDLLNATETQIADEDNGKVICAEQTIEALLNVDIAGLDFLHQAKRRFGNEYAPGNQPRVRLKRMPTAA